MTAARTPVHSYYVDADFNVCYGSQIMEPLEIVATIETLTAENEALREALMDIVEIASHRWRALPHGTPEKDRLAKARAALAKDGAR